jgi:uncharacterized membrane protein
MEELLRTLTGYAARFCEAAAVAFITFGAVSAAVKAAVHAVSGKLVRGWRKELFVWFGVWMLLGLQYALAADILRSVITPSWTDIGQLAAIAAIRTFLNYFLERDISKAAEESNAIQQAANRA